MLYIDFSLKIFPNRVEDNNEINVYLKYFLRR